MSGPGPDPRQGAATAMLSLEDVSARLGVSPSAVKKRVASLSLPVERGPRGKLLFDPSAYAMLEQADALLRAGQGFEAVKRQLALEKRVPQAPAATDERPSVMVQLRRRKAEAAVAAKPVDGAWLSRLDAALRLLEEKDRANTALQERLLSALEEQARVAATAAAFQERAQNLQHEVGRLRDEIKLLAAPPERPWWRFWR